MQADPNNTAALPTAVRADEAWRPQAPLPPRGGRAEPGRPAVPGGMTPLMAAAVSGCEALVELLLRCGADPARRDARGHTAASYAREAGHPLLADRLDRMVELEKNAPATAGA